MLISVLCRETKNQNGIKIWNLVELNPVRQRRKEVHQPKIANGRRKVKVQLRNKRIQNKIALVEAIQMILTNSSFKMRTKEETKTRRERKAPKTLTTTVQKCSLKKKVSNKQQMKRNLKN